MPKDKDFMAVVMVMAAFVGILLLIAGFIPQVTK